jgi:hypothetical protein
MIASITGDTNRSPETQNKLVQYEKYRQPLELETFDAVSMIVMGDPCIGYDPFNETEVQAYTSTVMTLRRGTKKLKKSLCWST